MTFFFTGDPSGIPLNGSLGDRRFFAILPDSPSAAPPIRIQTLAPWGTPPLPASARHTLPQEPK